MARVNRIVEIDASENGEDVGLQESHQQFERGERNRQSQAATTAPSQPRNTERTQHGHEAAEHLEVMWPASMLANSRTLWETGRDRNDITSMTVTSGRM